MLIFKIKNLNQYLKSLIYFQVSSLKINTLIIDYSEKITYDKDYTLIQSNYQYILFNMIFLKKCETDLPIYYKDDNLIVTNHTITVENVKVGSDIYNDTVDIVLCSDYNIFLANFNRYYLRKIDENYKICYDSNNMLTVIYIWKKISFFSEIIDTLIRSVKHSDLKIILLIEDYQHILKKKYSSFDIIYGPYYQNLDKMYSHIISSKLSFLIDEDNYQYVTFIDNNLGLKNEIDLLSKFVDINLPVSSLMVTIYNTYFNNLWFDRTENGYFKASTIDPQGDHLYLSYYANFLVFFNKPMIQSQLNIDKFIDDAKKDKIPLGDFDIMISNFFYRHNIPIFTFNHRSELGYIVEDTEYHNDPYQNLKDLSSNRYFWMKHYLSNNIIDIIYTEKEPKYVEPIPYLFEIDFFSKKFCSEILQIAEDKDSWSNGKNDDKRIVGGYEAVPTVDTHLNQLDLDKMWSTLLHKIISPIVEKFYLGFETKDTNISFIVKYSMDGQKKLRPHHDSSSYTVNIALNNPDEYEGGGTHFIKTDYTKKNCQMGTMLLHPGRVTHYHQGLPITKGKRYILVAFID